ncbi:MAG: methyltransferase domain-containing protein [Sandaracinus sp.]|nr:methyltransferase domain-containing protein [Sandaracinus sp.]
MKGAAEGWWEALYDEHLATVLLERDEEPTETLDFLERTLRLRKGDRVFDQCCGIGSLAVPLAERGFSVVGCDLGEGYAARGNADAHKRGVVVELVTADAFTFVPSSPCHGAFNWWTGFGYARDDTKNVEMLRRVHEALVPGGRFALDTMNVPGVIRGFRPEVTIERAGITLTRLSSLDLDAGLIHKRWLYSLPDGRRVEHESTVRLHTPWELRALLLAAGFEAVELLGGLDGARLDVQSTRCIAVATKAS